MFSVREAHISCLEQQQRYERMLSAQYKQQQACDKLGRQKVVAVCTAIEKQCSKIFVSEELFVSFKTLTFP